MIVLLATMAAAEVRIDGSSGGVTAPTAEMLPPEKMAFAFGLSGDATSEGAQIGALPFGAGFSYTRDTEVGLHLDLQPRGLDDPTFYGTRVGAVVRQRVLGRDEIHAPLVLELAGTGVTGDWGGSLTAITGFKVWGIGVYPSAGVGWSEQRQANVEGHLVVARYLQSKVRMLGELNTRVGLDGLQAADARIGVRVAAYRRAHLLAWAGGGLADGAPWGGGGLTVALYALDPLEVDRDRDEIPDWQDTCPFQGEDDDDWEDDDGCPDPDNDGDGIPDAQDETPNGEKAEEKRGYPDDTPHLRMRIHERGFPGEDPDAP